MSTTRTSEHEVVVAGAGPTGMMLASELTLAGVDVLVVERRMSAEIDGSRAGGLYPRTIEVLDQRGIAERFVDAGETHPSLGFGHITLDISDFPTRHNYILALWQREFERILAGWVEELGVPVLRGRDVVGAVPGADGVDVGLDDGSSVSGRYLVGCDGGRSAVRKAASIDFPGLDASTSWMIAEVEMDGDPEFGFRRDSVGTHAIGRRAPDEPIRLVLTEREVEHRGEPGLGELREALVGVYGTDFGLRRATWISRFTDMSRQAAEYRRGRILLAGDAAHVHPPLGGQGLNTGVQDAVNLGWKLAAVVAGAAPERLLDTYHAERHPVGARVLHNTMAQVALTKTDERHEALRETVGQVLTMDEPRRHVAGMLSGLDIRYELGDDDAHPLVGRRMPDLDLHTPAGPTRLFELLHPARPVLLTLDGSAVPDGDVARADRVDRIGASGPSRVELPVIGEVVLPPAVLIRPDGHVAWAGDVSDAALADPSQFLY